MELTLIANLLDSKYSQIHINNFYTQAKNLIEQPFDFFVFTTQEELDKINSTKKRDGFVDGIQFHVPKYGKQWLEIDLIQHTKDNGVSFFTTPNVLLNDPMALLSYKGSGIDKVLMQDENVTYYIHKNKYVQNLIQKWDRDEQDITFYNYEFKQEFQVNELPSLPFLNTQNKDYPISLTDDIVTFPYWYTHTLDSYVETCYNRSIDLYPYLPSEIEMEVNGFSYDEVVRIFNKDFLGKSRMTKLILSNDVEEPSLCEDFYDISEYFLEFEGVSVDVLTDLTSHDEFWWGSTGILYRKMGNITATIDDINNKDFDKQITNAKALLKSGARVFWQYTRTTQSDNDIEEARALSKKHKFSGFTFIENKPPELPVKEERIIVKELPDYKLIELDTLQTKPKEADYVDVKVKFEKKVRCKSKIENKCYIDKRGNVFPCVYTAREILEADINPYEDTDIIYNWKANNCKLEPLESILTNAFYTAYFNNKLKLDPSNICKLKCGACKNV